MQEFMIDLIGRFGYFAVAFLIFIENLFPPIPSEVILAFAGFVTTRSTMNILGTVIASTIGSMAGAVVFFVLGRVLPYDKIESIVNGKVGRVLHFKAADLRRAKGWFLRHGNRTVFFCRFIPVVRSLISIPAGLAHMKWPSFLIFSTLGTAIWNTVLVFLGALAGEAWESVVYYVSLYSKVFYVIGAVAVVALVAIYLRRRYLKKKRPPVVESADVPEAEEPAQGGDEASTIE